MKCSLNCLISFLWYFKRLSLSYQADVALHIVRNETLSLVKKTYINVKSPGFLTFYEKNDVRFMVVVTKDDKSSIFRFDSGIFKSFRMDFLGSGYNDPKIPQVVPDDVFTFPAVLIADGQFENIAAHGELMVINMGAHPATSFDITTDPAVSSRHEFEYGNPVWLSNDKFIVCRMNSITIITLVSWELVLYNKNKADETGLWKGVVLDDDSTCRFPIVLYKNVWNSFDALYTINLLDGSLNLMWTETKENKPGNWLRRTEIKKSLIDKNEAFMDIKLVDLNNDGKLELLLSLASNSGEIRAYQIPTSGDFRNLKKYREIKLHSDFKRTRTGSCPNTLKAFHPFPRNKSKPWILYSGDNCGSAGYLYPESEDVDDWRYQKHRIIDDVHWVSGVEAADIDLDGVVEIFISLHSRNVIVVFSLAESSLISNLTISPIDPIKGDEFESGSLPPDIEQMEISDSCGSILPSFSSCERFYVFLIFFTSRFFV